MAEMALRGQYNLVSIMVPPEVSMKERNVSLILCLKFLLNTLYVKFIWQDIMCKYWSWLNTSKSLSVMHAKAQSLDSPVCFLSFLGVDDVTE